MTVGNAPLLIKDQTRDRRKQLRCIPNLHRITEEDSIFWFDLCGWIFSEGLDNNNGGSYKTMTPVVTGH